MAENHDNPLALMTPAELHYEGLEYLLRARIEFEQAPSAAGAASIALGHFFSSMSADNLAAVTGSHRTDENTPPRGTPAVRANEFTGHHG